MNFTIFQKMLIAPVVAMALYCCYFYITYVGDKEAIAAIESIQNDYLPAMELAGENILLFDSVVTQMKDAVLSGEMAWLNHSQQVRDQIHANLSKLEHYKEAIPAEEIECVRENFSLYYQNAYALSLVMLGDKTTAALRNNALVENVERYHSTVSSLLNDHKQMVQERVRLTVQQTNQRLNDRLRVGVLLGIFLVLVVIGLTFHLSRTTRKNFNEIIERMKYLAQGQPDFSKRLVQHSPDELGVLTGWFNLLSEKLEQDYKKIELLSITDKLTSLYNRTKIDQLFTDELKRAERYGEGFSVILIDLDYFKSVNDTYGHQVCDTVLQEMSRLLRESVRKTDYVGRWGGEEFLVISPQSDIRHALHLAEKLRKMINEYNFSSVGRKTASFGVVSHRAGDCADSMMQRADECLYIAKEQGRNRVVGET
jgi:diguanylate cyclase (GGDEF)-like protein